MIKFFRQIPYKLMNENKTSKYFKYAIGEIILVVIGILIALQINNWNQNRTNENLEAKYQVRLLEDLKEEKAIMEATLNYSEEVKRHAKKAITLFENPLKNEEDPAEGLIDFYQASQIQSPASAKSTYQELIASGQINLIKNDDLKTSLIRYYEYNWTNAKSVNLPSIYRENLRGKMSNAIQEEIRNNCDDVYVKIRKTYEVTLPKTCNINIDINIAKSELLSLKKDESLKKDLRSLIGNIEAKNNYIKSLKKQLEDLINQFETNIK